MDTENGKPRVMPIIGFLVSLWLLSIIVNFFIGFNIDSSDSYYDPYANVAVIKFYGTITTTGESGFMDSVLSSNEVIQLLEEAEYNDNIKVIVLDINSGGGSGVASEEIANKLKSINKTKVAWIRDIGASGAYWVASSTDYIVASKMSLVGSIGVIGSYLEVSQLLERYNITYRRLVSGKYKDSGSPFKELTIDEEKMMQNLIDEMHGSFVNEVALNRNLTLEQVSKLATGEVFTGRKAKELGLIDEVGGINEVTRYIENELNITVGYTIIENEESLIDILSKISSTHGYSVGKGIGSFLYDNEQNIKI